MDTLTELFSTSAAQRVGWALIHFLWQGAVVALLLAVALGLLRNRSAQARWVLSCAALALMAVLPVATGLMVGVESPGRQRSAPAAGTADGIPTPPSKPADPAGGSVSFPPPGLARDAGALRAMPPAVQPAAVSWPRELRGAIQPTLPWAILAWLSGVTLMSVWHLGGWLAVRRMKRLGTRPVEPALLAVLARLLPRLRIRRPVRLLESVRVAVPLVLGWLRPVILLPVGAVTGLTPQQLEAILAHELAHIRRWDSLVLALQAVMETLLFYHPAVWWVSRQIRQESERCCDDLAVGICGDRRGYAHALAKVAEFGARGPALAAGATGGKLLPRIRRLLGAERPGALSFGRCLSGVLALGTLVAIAIAVGVSCSSLRGAQVDAADRPGMQPAVADKAPFDTLTVAKTSTWPWDRTITIRGDGTYTFDLALLDEDPRPNGKRYIARYRLRAEPLRRLEELLEATEWLARPAKVTDMDDGTRYALTLVRSGRKNTTVCYGDQERAYQDLIRFIERIDAQEWLLYQIASDGQYPAGPVHELAGELDAVLGNKPGAALPYAPVLDYERLLPGLESLLERATAERQGEIRDLIRRVNEWRKAQPAEGEDQSAWPKAVVGLSGRLVVPKRRITTSEYFDATLQLKNVGASPLAVQTQNPFALRVEVKDAAGNLVKPTSKRCDVWTSAQWATLAPGGSVGFQVGFEAKDGGKGSHLDTITDLWRVSPGKYTLLGTYTSKGFFKDLRGQRPQNVWEGEISLPPVEIEVAGAALATKEVTGTFRLEKE